MSWTRSLVFLPLLSVPVTASAQPYAFVTSAAGDSVAILDLDGDTLIGSIPLKGLPSGAAVSEDGSHLYVALTVANSLALIDTATGAVTVVPVGTSPSGIATDSAFVYVANTGDDTVSVYDITAGAVVQTIPTGPGPLDLAVGGGRLYVADVGGGVVSVFDLLGGRQLLAHVEVGRLPSGLALDSSAARLFVANTIDDTVSVVDTNTLTTIATVPVSERPRGLALDAVAGRLYVAGFQNSTIQAFDTATLQVVGEGPSQGSNPLDVALGPDGRLYVVHMQEGKSLTVLDAVTLVPLTAIEMPPGPVTFAGFGGQIPALAAWDGEPPKPARDHLAPPPRAPHPPVTSHPRQRSPEVWEILDTEFNPFDWLPVALTGAQTTTQQSDGGHPGAWRRTEYLAAGSGCHLYDRVYLPEQDGPITSIDVSFDHRVTQDAGSILERVVVQEDGILYSTAPQMLDSFFWESALHTGLTAEAFESESGTHPHFASVAHHELRFGYCSQNPVGMLLGHGVDNFHVVVAPGLPGGLIRFEHGVLVVPFFEDIPVTVRRVGGSVGIVGANLTTDCEFGGVEPSSLTWRDGDSSPRTVTVHCGFIQDGFLAFSVQLRGAAVRPPNDTLAIILRNHDPGSALVVLFETLEGLLAAFSPAWFLALAGPAAVLAARRRRRGRV
jgi:YVTN family beta-propeller protein